jgi:hypothetical protein
MSIRQLAFVGLHMAMVHMNQDLWPLTLQLCRVVKRMEQARNRRVQELEPIASVSFHSAQIGPAALPTTASVMRSRNASPTI